MYFCITLLNSEGFKSFCEYTLLLRYLWFGNILSWQTKIMKFTKHTLKKVEDLFDELDYEIIYGKGNFQSGYCVVESQKKVVINRYFEVEARINSLVDILSNFTIKEGDLDEKSSQFLKNLLLISAKEKEEELAIAEENKD